MTEDELRKIITYQKINSTLAHWESFKVIFGDVAQYKDWEKRAKSMFGPIEHTYFDSTGEANNYFNKNKKFC